jgi:Oxidoreductase family, NAD-binding Rossmann fold
MDPHGGIDPGGCVDSEGRIGWGVLGAAGVARRRFLPALKAARNARLVVLGSRSLGRAAAAVEAVGQGRPAASYEVVLEDREVDAVYIPCRTPYTESGRSRPSTPESMFSARNLSS